MDQLQPYLKRIKAGPPPTVVNERPNEFKRQQKVASGVTLYGPSPSDYADKPFTARIKWESLPQESKIFPTRERAEKSTAWEAPGKIVGDPRGVYGQLRYNAVLYYRDGRWELDSLEWGDYDPAGHVPGDRSPARFNRITKDSPDAGKNPWWGVLLDAGSPAVSGAGGVAVKVDPPGTGRAATWGDKYSRKELDRPLGMGDLKVGAFGDPREIKARVREVIDEKSVVLGVEDRRNGPGRYDTLVWVNCQTKGLTNGKAIGSLHDLFVPLQFAHVSGTKAYSTAPGSTVTVLVIDMLSPDAPYAPEE
jgi:hypothetical protein